mmetsp:Transcript_18446/g.41026  ORF Transcript_18446/g.41026 Transcript_18446/m.41026 type:complete len:421 (+) Transcript_18446:109-1371(+)
MGPTDGYACVTVQKGKARLFQNGNPIIYGGAVEKVDGEPKVGQEVLVKDIQGNLFGRGFFNPASMYRVRLTATKEDPLFESSLEELLLARIGQAVSLRRAMLLPRPDTSVYRLVNGEGDRLGGLIVDVLDDTVVVQSSAIWVELHKDIIRKALTHHLHDTANPKTLLWRRADSRLKQDGWNPLDPDMASMTAEEEEDAGESEVVESGVRYTLCASTDQKTGFYCDQRENRQLVRSLSQGKSVLDAYCYSGGFTLNAVGGGATSVLALDSSARALEALEKNVHLNFGQDSAQSKKISFMQGDAVAVMQQLRGEGRTFDVVVCDPPKLAPNRNTLDKATNKYTKINSLAMSLVSKEGGLLLTCTCSAAMTQSDNFLGMLQAAARIAQREVRVVSSSGAAGDHPTLISYPEGRYLTAVLLHVA